MTIRNLSSLTILLAVVPCVYAFGHRPGSGPQVCYASIDGKGMVQIRAFGGDPGHVMTIEYEVETKPGVKVKRPASVGKRFASETVLTINAEALDVHQDGMAVAVAKLRELLATETPVLVTGKALTPVQMKILKTGTIVIICPVPIQGHGGYGHGIARRGLPGGVAVN